MTESEWLACTNPKAMLEFMRSKPSDRKLRLFTCACCRRIWSLMTDERSQMAVEVAERFSDGLASPKERKAATKAAMAAREDADAAARKASPEGSEKEWGPFNAAFAAMIAVSNLGHDGFDEWDAANAAGYAVEFLTGTPKDAEHVAQVAFVLDLFGNPFRAVTVDRAWLTPTVVSVAASIYTDRAFDRLPILADALEEAGCTNPDILGHCRSEGPHVRGCWVVDLILGKE